MPPALTWVRDIGIESASLAEFRHVAQGLERRLDTAEVGGSIPPVPTMVDGPQPLRVLWPHRDSPFIAARPMKVTTLSRDAFAPMIRQPS